MIGTIEKKNLNDIATWMTSVQETGLPDILKGVFFMDGNPLPDTCITMYNVEWDSQNLSLFIPVYGSVQWTFHNSIPGWFLLLGAKISQFGYKMQFEDATLKHAQIIPFFFGLQIPKWIFDLTMDQIGDANNGDTWKRKNLWFGGSIRIAEYTLRRVVNADGSYTPAFIDMLNKAPNECLIIARN
ncbi:hypothetical protein [Calothrix sp. PCC 6303]|uniref:hypothetical protein n=1 Tax=Calothrix sp. PCC 6303 TaxID=1170562 RepID=UPI0002A04321|nr:hypothetical protein [Calothrix sp. PCC 6303]AFZ02567.1 hypothetical protein Cal6303_3642 [Calothrix sp. PCC 6303]